MDIIAFRDFCLNLKGVTEELPFDDKTLVFKVMGKIFAITDIDNFESINLKCEPQKAIELREKYDSIKAGYHMNKKHWNTVFLKNEFSDKFLEELILDSYHLVIKGLPKKIQIELQDL